jgi:F0F1-type ATP synthase assembly protein I
VPDTAQVTPFFSGSFITVAVKFVVALTITLTAVCERVIATGASTVIVAAADFVGSVTDVAVSVTSGGLGTLGGAE